VVAITHPLVERIADPVRYRANDLALHDAGVDELACVMNKHYACDLHLSGIEIDLDFGDGSAVGVRHGVDDDVLRGLDSGLNISRQRIACGSSHSFCDLGERNLHVRDAFDENIIAFDVEIRSIKLEDVTGDLQHFLTDLYSGDVGRGACHDRLSAVEPAKAHSDFCRIAGGYNHTIHLAAKLLCNDLGEHSLRTLTHSGCAGCHIDQSRWCDPDTHLFKRTAAGSLHVVCETNSDIAALGSCLVLSPRKVGPTSMFNGVCLACGVVPCVQNDWDAATGYKLLLERHRFCGNEIAPADFRAIELQFACSEIKEPLHDEYALRLPGSSDWGHRNLVR